MMPVWLSALLLAAASPQAVPVPDPATPPIPAPPTPAEAQTIGRAARLGQLLYAYDRAAWVATDALKAKMGRGRLGPVGGWVVEPRPERLLTVSFYSGRGDDARVVFTADVRNGQVTGERVVTEPMPLSPRQRTLARARDVAAAEAVARKFRPCTRSPFNTVVLPPADLEGPIAVYLLSAQTDAATWPMGGHYRVMVGGDGRPLSARPFTAGCLNMTPPRPPAGGQAVGLFVNHLLDPVPTEVHVFTSYAARMPVMVGTREKKLWQVVGARITPGSLTR